MKPVVHFSMDSAQGRFGPCALTIGNFDGVHRGHQALVKAACDYARPRQISPAVLTFHPHPAVFVAPQRVPELICSLEERIKLLSEAGAECIMVLPFNEQLALCAPEDFISKIVREGLNARAVFVGENFRFGHKQAGTTETLKELGRIHDFEACFIPPVRYRGKLVSSSIIRQSIAASNVSLAGRLLGRCFSLEGEVVKGQGIGSKQTVPTLNLKPTAGRVTPLGVYVTQAIDPSTGRRWPAITNCGTRPTFEGAELTVETFLLEALDGAPPQQIQLQFRRFLRQEKQFSDAAALKTQILRDVARAQTYWRRVAVLL